jgi:glutamyl-tRNA reductase
MRCLVMSTPKHRPVILRRLRAQALQEVNVELNRALRLHGRFASAHEGWAVIYEEVDELWDEVKKRKRSRSPARLRREACQVAAMAVRFMLEVTPRA